jgi:DNA-binding beta-propeller fold protein YncE
MDDARFRDELRRYWDEIAHGGGAAPGNLEPELAATIRRLHAVPDVPAPDPDYARRLRRSLVVATSAPLPLGSTAHQTPNGHTAPEPGWHRPVEIRGPEAPRWRHPERWLAAAALLVVIATGLLASWPRLRPGTASIEAPLVVSPIEPVWQSTGGPDPIVQPGGMAIDREGNLWVADGQNDRFQIISPDGTFLETWGEEGAADGQFNFYSTIHSWGFGDIAFDASGNFYVADTGNYRIQKFAPDRSFLLAWGTQGEGDGQFLTPTSIAVGPGGVVYVSDEAGHDIQKFDANGQFLGEFGRDQLENGQLASAYGLTVADDGTVWVTDYDNHRIARFDADGQLITAWGIYGLRPGELSKPADIAIDEGGRVYVADAGNNRIQVFTPDGRLLAATQKSGPGSSPMLNPNNITVGPSGAIYVSDAIKIHAFRAFLPLGAELTP